VNLLRMSGEHSAGNRACADGDDDLRLGSGVERFCRASAIFFVTRAGDKYSIGMPGGSDELDAEPGKVKDQGIEDIGIRFTGVTAARAHLAQTERTPEKTEPGMVQPARYGQFIAADKQVIAVAYARRWLLVKAMPLPQQAVSHPPQKMHLPRSSVRGDGVVVIAPTGHAFTHAAAPALSIRVGPHRQSLKRSGRTGAVFG